MAEHTFGPMRFESIQNVCSITKTKATIPWDGNKVQFSYSNSLDTFFEMFIISHSFVRFIATNSILFVWRSFWKYDIWKNETQLEIVCAKLHHPLLMHSRTIFIILCHPFAWGYVVILVCSLISIDIHTSWIDCFYIGSNCFLWAMRFSYI